MTKIGFYLEKVWFFILYSLMLFPILPRGIESVLMISFFIISVLIWLKNRELVSSNLQVKDVFIIILFSTVFLVYVISLIYSTNLQEGVNRVIKVSPIILFPLAFRFLCKDIYISQKFNKLTNVYLLAITFGLLLLHIVFFNELYFLESTQREIRQGIEKVTDIHGTYMSIWLGFGVFILFSKIETKLNFNQLKKIIPQIVLIGYFLYWQIIIGARTPFVMTIVLTIGFFIYRMKINKSIIFIFLIVIISSFFLKTSKSNLIYRVKTVFSLEHSFPEGDYSKEFKNISSEDIRRGIYFCSWDTAKQSLWVGYGIGDVQDKLESCYKEKLNTNTYQIFKFNSHNQYFQVLLSSGIFALSIFLLSLITPLYLSWHQNNYLWLLFTLFIMACFLTENVIDRHDGVIFYSLFNSILMYNNLKTK